MLFFLFLFLLLGAKTSRGAPFLEEFFERYTPESLFSYDAPQAEPPAAGSIAPGAYSAEPTESLGMYEYSHDYQPPPPIGQSQQPTEAHHQQQSQAQANPSVFQHSDTMLSPNHEQVPRGDQSYTRQAAVIPDERIISPASPVQFFPYILESSMPTELNHDTNPAPWLQELYNNPRNSFVFNSHNQQPSDVDPLPLKESFITQHQRPQLQHQQPEHFPGHLAYSSSHTSSSFSDTTKSPMKLSSHASQNNGMKAFWSEQAENSENDQDSRQDLQATPFNHLAHDVGMFIRYKIYPDEDQSRKQKREGIFDSLELKAPSGEGLKWLYAALKPTSTAIGCDYNNILDRFTKVRKQMPPFEDDFDEMKWPPSYGNFIHYPVGDTHLVVRLIEKNTRKALTSSRKFRPTLEIFVKMMQLYSSFMFFCLGRKSQANIPDHVNQHTFLEWFSKALYGDPQHESFKIPILGQFSIDLLPPKHEDCYHPVQEAIIQTFVIKRSYKYLQASIALFNHWFKTQDPMTWKKYFKTDHHYSKFIHEGISELSKN